MTCNLLFATPVWSTTLDQQLTQQLLVDGLQYQGDNFFDLPAVSVQKLKSHILEFIDTDIKTSAYFEHYENARVSIHGRQNPVEPGESDTPHWHPDKTLIGVYYVQVPENSGDILLHDPRGAVEKTWSEPTAPRESKGSRTFYRIKPQPGLLLFFPSYLIHSVETNLSDQTRLSIIIDIYAK
jgi:uncharacterized protein (TIGR02466 family)